MLVQHKLERYIASVHGLRNKVTYCQNALNIKSYVIEQGNIMIITISILYDNTQLYV